MSQLQELCDAKGVRLQLVPGVKTPYDRLDDWQKKSNQYTATLSYKGHQVTTEFFTGSGWKEAPKSADVLSSLILDGRALGETYTEWLSEFGYEPSASNKRLYNKCLLIGKKVHKLLGDELDTFAEAEH